MISTQPKVFPGHKMLPINTHVCIWIKETVVWLSNALGAFAIAENLYVCWRVRLLRAQDDRWGMFGKRRNSLISASLGPTAETATHHPCFSPQIRHMYPINSYQPCMRKSSTVIEKSQDDFSWNGKQLNTYEGYKREFTWTTTDVHKQSHYWNHFWKAHASFKAVSFRGRALCTKVLRYHVRNKSRTCCGSFQKSKGTRWPT